MIIIQCPNHSAPSPKVHLQCNPDSAAAAAAMSLPLSVVGIDRYLRTLCTMRQVLLLSQACGLIKERPWGSNGRQCL